MYKFDIKLIAGTWEREILDSICKYTISIDDTNISVKGYDEYDGEEFVISDAKIVSNNLEFISLMPSTGWRVNFSVRLISKNKAEATTTFTTKEKWLKEDHEKLNNSKHPLVGTWSGEKIDAYDSRCIYSITLAKNGFNVTAHDIIDDENIKISKVVWDGNILTFNSFMPSIVRVGHHIIKLINDNEIEFVSTFTLKVFWVRTSKTKTLYDADTDPQP